MAFKKIKRTSTSYDNIESLFSDLSRSSEIKSLYYYQADIIRSYEEKGLLQRNVTIELPTGSGKTLIGLLIGEFNRRVNGKRVLYLCPTKQLVNQVVEMANSQYGIKAVGFTGSKKKYSPESKFAYNNAESIAVTTYSSLFNTHPWFDEPDLILIDDAHTSENYISSNWSVLIKRSEHGAIYNAFIEAIKDSLSFSVYKRLTTTEGENIDRNTLEKLSNITLFDKKEDLYETLSVYLDEHKDLRWPWSMIREKLECCQIFFSWREVLIRPLIPPALENIPFNHAQQRIFMSATLGEGGDLQRLTGIKHFHQIPIPAGWDKQGMGRRFFMFPNLSLKNEEIGELMSELLVKNDRTVILVSSDDQVQNFRSELQKHHSDIEFFTAYDIEESKDEFITSEHAAIVLANRFDGIDFAEEQSRLLFLVGIPYASNLQEKFFQSRMNASIIFNDRNKTRLIQAIGRCTRSPNDYSAICVLGEKDLSDWLTMKSKYKYLHPELQAELNFGIENSKEATKQDFLDNYDLFISQSDDWKDASSSIIEDRKQNRQYGFDGASQLEEA
jgi:Rad3-related DNA helicase